MIIGITAGSFDLCHTGHLFFLAQCKAACDELIVCLQTNPQIDRREKEKPVETTFERWVRLMACVSVDRIIPYDTERDLSNILVCVDWSKRFLDMTYMDKQFTMHDYHKGDIIFFPREHDYSSTNLRNEIRGIKI